ncbi:MAG: hypothetical protein M1829_003400 [Trizodia sp. TS-e1964]|nr:MAG: hypothetical protein M1829_003400 [Trizodia sp. TS-e1964]
MDGLNTDVTHYAILIGVNAYPNRPLKCCVRDVQKIKNYLKSSLRNFVDIQIIAASQTGPESSATAEEGVPWPSRDNVISAFERVNSRARAGNFVYIHFSGHGTRKPSSGNFSNKSSGDLALVLLNGKKDRECYLVGFELAGLLKAMVDKGLVVTLVLDCCFSGSVYRRDNPSIRFLPYNPEVDLECPPNAKKTPEVGLYRDTSMHLNWLIRPDRYAVLAACGPHEVAIEPKFEGEGNGALSYYLLSIFNQMSLTKRHGDIYDHLRAKFRKSGIPQTPVLYGNRNQGFFGPVNSDITAAAVSIIVRENGTLELQAGQAHGVSTDDQFVLYPFDRAQDDDKSQEDAVVGKVASSRSLTSDLEQLSKPSIPVRTGWMARTLTRLSLQRFLIRLAPTLLARDEWLVALRERSLEIQDNIDTHPFSFDVVLNNREYKILDESGQEIINLMSLPQDQTSVCQIASILEHLARFQLVRDLVNKAPTDSFQASLDAQIRYNGEYYGPDCTIEMEHRTRMELIMTNRGEKALYVFIYNLGPCWRIVNANGGSFLVVEPERDRKHVLEMTIPKEMREKGHHSCKDIVKVFVTSQPTSFDLLELPDMGGWAKTAGTDRSGKKDSSEPEDWMALNFFFHNSLQPDTSNNEMCPTLS